MKSFSEISLRLNVIPWLLIWVYRASTIDIIWLWCIYGLWLIAHCLWSMVSPHAYFSSVFLIRRNSVRTQQLRTEAWMFILLLFQITEGGRLCQVVGSGDEKVQSVSTRGQRQLFWFCCWCCQSRLSSQGKQQVHKIPLWTKHTDRGRKLNGSSVRFYIHMNPLRISWGWHVNNVMCKPLFTLRLQPLTKVEAAVIIYVNNVTLCKPLQPLSLFRPQ